MDSGVLWLPDVRSKFVEWPPVHHVLTKSQTQCLAMPLILMVLCFTMLKPAAMECCAHLMIHRKNSPVQFVPNRGHYFVKIIHANFGQQYIHAKAECIEFLLLCLIFCYLTWTLLHSACQCIKCTFNIQTAGYTSVHILRPWVNLHRNLQ